MTNQDRDAQTPDDSNEQSLELNKETLQDLDLEAADAEGVKGGASVVYNYPSGVYLSGNVAMSQVRSGPVPSGQSLASY